MTIHYVWISKFRNLYNEHVNLTGHYSIELDKNERFKIKKNRYKLPNNFWGERTSSVSALIGKNGSGKTNILELLTYILFNPKSIAADSEFILLYTREFGWRDEEVKVFHNLSNADRVRGTNLELSFTSIYEQLDKNNDFKCIFFSNIIDSVKR